MFRFFFLGLVFFLSIQAAAHSDTQEGGEFFEYLDDLEFVEPEALACNKPSRAQVTAIEQGNAKRDRFLQACYRETDGSAWCDQLIRPNPSSVNTFRCTYGEQLPHQLIHPDESTWRYAIDAVHLIHILEGKGIRVCQIYNWWRPEPYNKNVGGAAGRHPFGTSVDVRFCSNQEAVTAFDELCTLRKQGKIRAIGYYGSSALHFGVGDRTANTWGKVCP